MDAKSQNEHGGKEEQLSESDEPDPDIIKFRLGRFIVEEILDNSLEPTSNLLNLSSVSSFQNRRVNHRIISENTNLSEIVRSRVFLFDNLTNKFVNAELYFNFDKLNLFTKCEKIFEKVKILESWNSLPKLDKNQHNNKDKTDLMKYTKNQKLISSPLSPFLKPIILNGKPGEKSKKRLPREAVKVVNFGSAYFANRMNKIHYIKNYLKLIENSFSIFDDKIIYKTRTGTFIRKERKLSHEKSCKTSRSDCIRKFSQESNLEKESNYFYANSEIVLKKENRQIEYRLYNKIWTHLEFEIASSFTIEKTEFNNIYKCGKIICSNCLSFGSKKFSDK
jgi:hypothetical protein